MSVQPSAGQIRVTKSAGTKSGIDLTGIQASGDQAVTLFMSTLREDLTRSGWFTISGRGQGQFRVLGSASLKGGGLSVECALYNVSNQRALMSQSYSQPAAEAVRLAHRVADDIVYAATGRKGIASGKIAMVGNASGHKELYLCNADGGNLVQLTSDRAVSIAPKWSPDGRQILYTSFLKRFPDVYLVTLQSGNRTALANYPGLNTGAAMSPDGKDVAIILSKDGNPELYVKNLRSGRLTRITETPQAAEASPSWSPDGQRIVYVSDSSGKPHLYAVSRNGGRPERLPGRGSEDVAPDWGRNGAITFCSRTGGSYQIAVYDPRTGDIRQVSSGPGDFEDPSWAPDGRHIVCSQTQNYRSRVIILDIMGDPPVVLTNYKGDWMSPAWSPE
ncbi:MAG: hypothetical protein AB7T27_01410 [Kiritimatiellia bacterium]